MEESEKRLGLVVVVVGGEEVGEKGLFRYHFAANRRPELCMFWDGCVDKEGKLLPLPTEFLLSTEAEAGGALMIICVECVITGYGDISFPEGDCL